MHWKGWTHPEDLPRDLRTSIHQGAIVPLVDPREASKLRDVVLKTFGEVLDIYLEDQQLRWRCEHVHRSHPLLPMEAVFAAVSIEVGISSARLRSIWYTSRRKARVVELVKQAAGGDR